MTSDIDLLGYAFDNMQHRHLRSWLTIVGIIIGIASIVLLVSIGQGLDKEIKSQLSSIGTSYVIILPGSPNSEGTQFGPPTFRGALYQNDADSIRRLPGVKSVSSAVVIGVANLEYKGERAGTVVVGAEPYAMDDFLSIGFEKGRFIEEGDQGGAVIGNTVAKTLFPDEVDYGKTFKINGRDFRVKGILNKGGTFSPYDSFVFIDMGVAREIGKTVGSKRIDRLFVIANSAEEVANVEKMVTQEIAKRHKVSVENRDFQTQTAQSISDSVSQITGILSVFLGLIASISLIVGMVGIANAMFTSVLERTREIGILKAVGATQAAITKIFLYEAGLIGMAGGILGAAIGAGLSILLSKFGVPSSISFEFIGLCIFLSFLVGLGSGFFPSRDAARMQPIEALRYE
ncbi:MAG: ABC transporter permease [Candidatus Micrarchaeota archaeon]